MSFTIKPLEWEEDDNDGRPMWRAIANAGLTYRIYDDGFPDSSVLLCLHHLELGRFSSLELAKAAAQSDYTSRILSALSSTPVGEMDAGIPFALVEKVENRIAYRIALGSTPRAIAEDVLQIVAGGGR